MPGGESDVTARVRDRRNVGRITCAESAFTERETAQHTADRVAEAHGLRGIGEAWLEISGHQAQTIATFVLHRDLASGEQIMALAEATDLATAFLDLAPEPHRYFTNGEWDELLATDGSQPDGVGFDPISDAAFDAGVICVGEGVAAILWVEDDE